MAAHPVIEASLINGMYVPSAILVFILGVFVKWIRSIANDVSDAKKELSGLKETIAREYATKELVDKVEIRILATLADFKHDFMTNLTELKRDIKADLNDLFDKLHDLPIRK